METSTCVVKVSGSDGTYLNVLILMEKVCISGYIFSLSNISVCMAVVQLIKFPLYWL